MNSSVFLSGLAFSAYFSWRLAVVAFPTMLLLVIPGVTYGKYLVHVAKKGRKEYGKANAIVEQALSSIKTVYSFTAEKRVLENYRSILEKTTRVGIKQGIAKGLAVGSSGIAFAIWAFIAWYGSRLVMYKAETGGKIYASALSFILAGLYVYPILFIIYLLFLFVFSVIPTYLNRYYICVRRDSYVILTFHLGLRIDIIGPVFHFPLRFDLSF